MTDPRIDVLWEWVDEWIIKENFCPFASPARKQNRIQIRILDTDQWSEIYDVIAAECRALIDSAPNSTTLIALSQVTDDFFTYLSLLEGAQSLIEQEGWLGTFQLASFHPDYQFEGENKQSVSHFTNRSPLPVIHILKEDDVSRVMPSQQHADDIVDNNILRLEAMGYQLAHDKIQEWRRKIAVMNS